MTHTRRTSPVIAAALALLLCVIVTGPAFAQAKAAKNPGSYHGELDFPISWKRYYSYAEWTAIMADLQKKYAAFADIQSIGKSRMGRDQYVLTITNKATGTAGSKPAMWIDGAIHGNEVNGITCALYVAWYLLTRYDYDPFVRDLVDRTTFYILPGLNVDANDSYVRFPNTENNPREPYRPTDDDGDGLYDEDQTEDVDGDGELSIMWVEDPAGDFKLSPDRRRFVPVGDPREAGQRFRRIGGEGFDNDGDGRINEDDIGGPDPNRNFPFGWGLESGYPYPLSEAETRNVFEFQLAHPNIFATFHFHNTGRLIMFQAPLAAPPPPGETAEARQQAAEQFNQRLAELAQDGQVRLPPRPPRRARVPGRSQRPAGHRDDGRAAAEGLPADTERAVRPGGARGLLHARRVQLPHRALGIAARRGRHRQRRPGRRRGVPDVDRSRADGRGLDCAAAIRASGSRPDLDGRFGEETHRPDAAGAVHRDGGAAEREFRPLLRQPVPESGGVRRSACGRPRATCSGSTRR